MDITVLQMLVMLSKERLNILTWLKVVSNFQNTERKQEEPRMKVSLWSWTDAGLSCSVLWKSFHSFDNGQITAMPTLLKVSRDAVN